MVRQSLGGELDEDKPRSSTGRHSGKAYFIKYHLPSRGDKKESATDIGE